MKEEIIAACVVFTFALVWISFGIVSLCGKGFLFNNAYIWASKKEREQMEKKPYYKQTGIVFVLITETTTTTTIVDVPTTTLPSEAITTTVNE